MTIEKALEIYNHSPAAYIPAERYIPYKGGYVLIGNTDGTIGCHHVLVKANGELGYTNPLIEPYNQKDVRYL